MARIWSPTPGATIFCLVMAQILYGLTNIAVVAWHRSFWDLAFFGFVGPPLFAGLVMSMHLNGTRFHWLTLTWHLVFMLACAIVNILWLKLAAANV